MNKLRGILVRLLATFVTYSLGVVTGSAIFAPELPLWKSAALAGCGATLDVVYRLAQAGRDGVWTDDEVDVAFGTTHGEAIKTARKVRSKAVTKAVDVYVASEKKADHAEIVRVMDTVRVMDNLSLPDDGDDS